MHTYILRRVLAMIPTLFGVTLVSFLIMQLAPGDPARERFAGEGGAKPGGNTREAYLVLKRDLQLDLPWVLNLRGFTDYAPTAKTAAWFRGRSNEELLKELETLGAPGHRLSGEERTRLEFLQSLGLKRPLPEALWNDEGRTAVLGEIQPAIPEYVGDRGRDVFKPLVDLARGSASDRKLKLGALLLLSSTTSEPFRYLYPERPKAGQTQAQFEADQAAALAAWKLWWSRNEKKYPQPTGEDLEFYQEAFAKFLAAPDDKSLRLLMQNETFEPKEMGFFAKKLLAETATPRERYVAAAVLKNYIPTPLKTELGFEAKDAELDEALANWELHYERNKERYERSTAARVGEVFLDTQYAKMLGRLLTFDFGRSSQRTREPVGELLLRALWVSAPIMLLSQLVIYLVAIPLGVLCAAQRNTWIDRSVTLSLFILYSVPAFIAGLLALVFFCYGDFYYWWGDDHKMKFFPMMGLHSPGAENFSTWKWTLDYLWHIFLPTTCLSLFSLASVAMYARGSMLDVLGQDYIRTARSVGVDSFTVVVKHTFRNSMITVITLFGGLLPAMLGGSVLVEYIFGIPGMGKLALNATENKDVPTLMAIIYLDAIVVMISILITDLLYVFADPRISFGSQESGK